MGNWFTVLTNMKLLGSLGQETPRSRSPMYKPYSSGHVQGASPRWPCAIAVFIRYSLMANFQGLPSCLDTNRTVGWRRVIFPFLRRLLCLENGRRHAASRLTTSRWPLVQRSTGVGTAFWAFMPVTDKCGHQQLSCLPRQIAEREVAVSGCSDHTTVG